METALAHHGPFSVATLVARLSHDLRESDFGGKKPEEILKTIFRRSVLRVEMIFPAFAEDLMTTRRLGLCQAWAGYVTIHVHKDPKIKLEIWVFTRIN